MCASRRRAEGSLCRKACAVTSSKALASCSMLTQCTPLKRGLEDKGTRQSVSKLPLPALHVGVSWIFDTLPLKRREILPSSNPFATCSFEHSRRGVLSRSDLFRRTGTRSHLPGGTESGYYH